MSYKQSIILLQNGQLYGFVKDEKRYFYIKDITGTILGIADESGDILGNYEYSAYGKCTVTDNTNNTNNIAEINPFRFKCYYYDTESGMYYCHTRYLVPEWGRWLNTDNPSFLQFDNINGMNLFAYCNNNPIMFSDPSGTMPKWLQWLIAGVVTAALVVGAVALTVVSGGIASPTLQVAASLGASILTGAAVSASLSLSQSISSGEIDLVTFGIDVGIGALSGALGFGMSKMFSLFGEAMGLYLNEMIIGGLQVGKVFGNILPGLFGKIIEFCGGLGFGAWLDSKIDSILNRQGTLRDRFLNNIQGQGFSSILEILKYLW